MQNLSAQAKGALIFLGISLVFVVLMGLQDRSRTPLVQPSTPRQPVETTLEEEPAAEESVTEESVTEESVTEESVTEESASEESADAAAVEAEVAPTDGVASTFFAVLSIDVQKKIRESRCVAQGLTVASHER